ncbi:rRNA 2'-O-methyltransferase fibrillarin-like [Pristis pectinata]|uniref:rRNA 2'-O-methyltransferase fibrillarin-like n=1 Tax=Pristis pectinata TaxID=685728 RepID=UPI00223D0EE1|nr:rRNA 2'-O-methyltransferase fibrillarin-like [Pristis pectinata]
MSYSVVSRAKSVTRAAQRGAAGEESRDRGGATGRGGMGKAPGRGRGAKTDGGSGAGTGLGRGSFIGTGGGKGSGKTKISGKSSSTSLGGGKGSSTVLQKCTATDQNAAPHKSGQKTTHCYGAYSVTVPDQKKRIDLQKKAAAELAALEKLKHRSIGQVSIIPSAVGGTLTQEEVRKKQQLAIDKARAKQNSTPMSVQEQEDNPACVLAECSGQQNPENEP